MQGPCCKTLLHEHPFWTRRRQDASPNTRVVTHVAFLQGLSKGTSQKVTMSVLQRKHVLMFYLDRLVIRPARQTWAFQEFDICGCVRDLGSSFAAIPDFVLHAPFKPSSVSCPVSRTLPLAYSSFSTCLPSAHVLNS